MQKWVHLVIRVQNRTVDVYLNGVLTEEELTKVPKQNFGNIHVGDTNSGMQVIYQISIFQPRYWQWSNTANGISWTKLISRRR